MYFFGNLLENKLKIVFFLTILAVLSLRAVENSKERFELHGDTLRQR